MTKQTNSVVAIDVSNIAATGAFIDKVMTAYNSVAPDLHRAACIAIHQACAYGRAENLGRVYDRLSKSDKLTFRMWVGKYSAYDVTAEGKQVKKHWAEMNTKAETFDKRFTVKSGAENFRKASKAAGYEAMLAEKPFFDREGNKNDDPFTLIDLMTQIKGFVKRVEREAAKAEITIPANINTELTALASIATETMAMAEMSRIAKGKAQPAVAAAT